MSASTRTEKTKKNDKAMSNKFAATFNNNRGRYVTLYMKNGKAMAGVLREFDHETVSIDTPTGVIGGTQVDCSDISSVSVK